MKRILIDTNIYSDAMRGIKHAVESIRFADEVILCPVVIAELLAGFKEGSRSKENWKQLEDFMNESRVKVVVIDEETAHRFSEIQWSLKKKGTPIPTNDIWIAACAAQNGALLISRDAHYKKIDGIYAEVYDSPVV